MDLINQIESTNQSPKGSAKSHFINPGSTTSTQMVESSGLIPQPSPSMSFSRFNSGMDLDHAPTGVTAPTEGHGQDTSSTISSPLAGQELADGHPSLSREDRNNRPLPYQSNGMEAPPKSPGFPYPGPSNQLGHQRHIVTGVTSVMDETPTKRPANQRSLTPSVSPNVATDIVPHSSPVPVRQGRQVPHPFPFIRAQAPKPPHLPTTETFKRNAEFLLNDGPVSDVGFARMHYQEDGTDLTRLCARLASQTARLTNSYKQSNNQQHSQGQFLQQRAESSAHAQQIGETPPSYAFVTPEIDERGRVVNKTMKTESEKSGERAAAVTKAGADYHEAFKRNLQNIF